MLLTVRIGITITTLSLALAASTARADTLPVPAGYPTIQACINAAVNGDECLVAPGTYNETINFIGKAITVRSSDGPDVTTIDATGLACGNYCSVVTCSSGESPNTVMDGFTTLATTVVGSGGSGRAAGGGVVVDCVGP